MTADGANGTGGTITIGGAYAPPIVFRAPWECPRCRVVNAPHADRCACGPIGVTMIPYWYPAEPNVSPADDGWRYRVTCTDGLGNVCNIGYSD